MRRSLDEIFRDTPVLIVVALMLAVGVLGNFMYWVLAWVISILPGGYY